MILLKIGRKLTNKWFKAFIGNLSKCQFTAVSYNDKEIKSFAVACDDIEHNRAHALLARNLILPDMKSELSNVDIQK